MKKKDMSILKTLFKLNPENHVKRNVFWSIKIDFIILRVAACHGIFKIGEFKILITKLVEYHIIWYFLEKS